MPKNNAIVDALEDITAALQDTNSILERMGIELTKLRYETGYIRDELGFANRLSQEARGIVDIEHAITSYSRNRDQFTP